MAITKTELIQQLETATHDNAAMHLQIKKLQSKISVYLRTQINLCTQIIELREKLRGLEAKRNLFKSFNTACINILLIVVFTLALLFLGCAAYQMCNLFL